MSIQTEHDFTDIFKGVVSVETDNGIYRPLRLTNYQLNRYKDIPRCIYPYACAGIKIEFITESETIAFGYLVGGVWNWWSDSTPQFDIYEDDILTELVPLDINRKGEVHHVAYSRVNADKPSKITIYFPHNAEVRICDISISNYAATIPKNKKILIMGDSISQGLMGNSASFCYTAILERFFDAELLNQSVGGDCFEASALDKAMPFIPTDIVVALGINDIVFVKDFEIIKKNMTEYFYKLESMYQEISTTVITPIYHADVDQDPEFGLLIKRVSNEIVMQAEKYGWRWVDGFKLVPHHARFFSDSAHPNDLGFAQYAINLIKEFK